MNSFYKVISLCTLWIKQLRWSSIGILLLHHMMLCKAINIFQEWLSISQKICVRTDRHLTYYNQTQHKDHLSIICNIHLISSWNIKLFDQWSAIVVRLLHRITTIDLKYKIYIHICIKIKYCWMHQVVIKK